MKRMYLLLLAFTLLSLTSVKAQVQANIFAYDLKASAASKDFDVDFSYTLNTDASAVTIIVSNGDAFEITDAGDLTKGPHTVTQRLAATTATGDYTWSVKAVGTADSPAVPTKVTDGTETALQFGAARGMAVDNSFDSPCFGRIYVTTIAGVSKTQGIFILDAALSDVTGQGNTAYTGGVAWHEGTASSPVKLWVGPDGTVYFADWYDSQHFMMDDPLNPSADFTQVLPVSTGTQIMSGWTYGSYSGGDLVYYTVNDEYGENISLLRYDIGSSALPYTDDPTVIYSSANLVNYGSIAPDGQGGWWFCQNRDQGQENSSYPGLIHIDDAGVRDYATDGFLGACSGGAVAVNADYTRIAVGGTSNGTASNQISIYEVDWDDMTEPLKNPVHIALAAGETASPGVQFDQAGNLIAMSGNASIRTISVYALPKAENAFTTPAPAAQAIKVIGGENYPDLAPDATPEDNYIFEQEGETLETDGLPEDIKRVIHRDGKLYVLNGVETSPTISIYDAADLTYINDMDLTGVADGIHSISDIGFTADGKLLACNKEWTVFTDVTRSFKVYIWDNDAAAPEIYYQTIDGNNLTDNHTANWSNAYVGETMAVSGPSWNATIYVSAVSQSGANETGMRFLAIAMKEGVSTLYWMGEANAATGDTDTKWGNYQFVISPLANDCFIVTSDKMPPTEFYFDPAIHHAQQIPLVRKGIFEEKDGYDLFKTNGANYFRYGGKAYMAAPVAEEGRVNAGLALFDITDGLDQAVKVSDKYPEAGLANVEAPYMMAYGTVDGKDIVLSILAENQGFATFKPATAKEFTVTFDAQGGSPEPDPITVPEGGKIAKPEDPEKEGYTFEGWFEAEADEPWDFDNDVVTEDITLYAQWLLDNGIRTVAVGDIRIDCEGKFVTIRSNSAIHSVKIYNLQGRTLVSQQGSASVYSITAPEKGVYIVETFVAGERNVQKIVVR